MDYTFNQPIICTFIRRYKRFFADFFYQGQIIVAHCANTGPMTGLLIVGSSCVLSTKSTGTLLYTWEAICIHNVWVGVNTHIPNKIIATHLHRLFPNETFRSEVKLGPIRADFSSGGTIIEVKYAHWARDQGDNCVYFPDTVTDRGSKQLKHMMTIDAKKYIIYLIMRPDINKLKIAQDIDMLYYRYMNSHSWRVLVFNCIVTMEGISLYQKAHYLSE